MLSQAHCANKEQQYCALHTVGVFIECVLRCTVRSRQKMAMTVVVLTIFKRRRFVVASSRGCVSSPTGCGSM